MSYQYFIEKVLGIQGINEIFIEETEKIRTIELKLERKPHKCPSCGAETDKIHDYRIQKIKDLPAFGKETQILLKKRRYVCPECKKKFYEETPWLAKYQRMTKRMIMGILEALRKLNTYTSVAKEYGISTTTVMRVFDHISYPAPELPVALSIDEFKGNTGGEKYNCIIADPLNHKVLDILPKRYDWYLQNYFLKRSKEERDRVQIFVSDMWKPYQTTAKELFENSMRVIDKYHWYRQVLWAFERVRKDAQKHLSSEYRKYFKHSKKLLLKQFPELNDEDKQAVNIMLYASPDLSTAHFYKEEFQKIIRVNKRAEAKKLMDEWISSASECGISSLEKSAKTLTNWKREILDSFTTTCTNGFIEGCNNKIKVLKRISFGCRNFTRFRNRILHIFSNQTVKAS